MNVADTRAVKAIETVVFWDSKFSIPKLQTPEPLRLLRLTLVAEMICINKVADTRAVKAIETEKPITPTIAVVVADTRAVKAIETQK